MKAQELLGGGQVTGAGAVAGRDFYQTGASAGRATVKGLTLDTEDQALDLLLLG
jgi:hypothetical protein